ncbi:MAG: hypothetical protein AVDCRST_MAG02-4215, partial [uncultured Rubrobacteraceae bacterium]
DGETGRSPGGTPQDGAARGRRGRPGDPQGPHRGEPSRERGARGPNGGRRGGDPPGAPGLPRGQRGEGDARDPHAGLPGHDRRRDALPAGLLRGGGGPGGPAARHVRRRGLARELSRLRLRGTGRGDPRGRRRHRAWPPRLLAEPLGRARDRRHHGARAARRPDLPDLLFRGLRLRAAGALRRRAQRRDAAVVDGPCRRAAPAGGRDLQRLPARRRGRGHRRLHGQRRVRVGRPLAGGARRDRGRRGRHLARPARRLSRGTPGQPLPRGDRPHDL